MNKDYVSDAKRLHLLKIRDYLLGETQPHIERYRDERDIGTAKTTLTEAQANELLDFRMRLRDIEKHRDFTTFPSFFILPPVPAFCNIAGIGQAEFESWVYQTAFGDLRDDVASAKQAELLKVHGKQSA